MSNKSSNLSQKVKTTKMTIIPDDNKTQALSVNVPLDAPHNQTAVKKVYRLEDSKLIASSKSLAQKTANKDVISNTKNAVIQRAVMAAAQIS